MIILALETSTEACSVALEVAGQTLERFELAPRRHAELLLPMIDELLLEAGLQKRAIEAVAFGRGPGAFTGVRLAASVAQGLAFGLSRPVLPVSSLAALAQAEIAAAEGRPIAAMMDARMGELYLGLYRANSAGLVDALAPERVLPPAEVTLPGPASEIWWVAGSGWSAYQEALQARLGERVRVQPQPRYPRAAGLLPLARQELVSGHWHTPAEAQPLYLRDKVALTISERQLLKAG